MASRWWCCRGGCGRACLGGGSHERGPSDHRAHLHPRRRGAVVRRRRRSGLAVHPRARLQRRMGCLRYPVRQENRLATHTVGHDMKRLQGLKIRLDRPTDREHPCCRNICTITAGGELVCTDCNQRRAQLSEPTAHWIEHIATRFGAPTTPIVVRKPHTNEKEAPPTEPTSHWTRTSTSPSTGAYHAYT